MATPARLDRLPAKESHGTALQESLRRYPMAVCVSVWHFGLTRSKNRALNSPGVPARSRHWWDHRPSTPKELTLDCWMHPALFIHLKSLNRLQGWANIRSMEMVTSRVSITTRASDHLHSLRRL